LHHANFFRATLFLVTVLSGGMSRAETAFPIPRPFYSFNQSPLIQIYGLPALG
jgi:hypothetical protein